MCFCNWTLVTLLSPARQHETPMRFYLVYLRGLILEKNVLMAVLSKENDSKLSNFAWNCKANESCKSPL
jgi:hypothetical protein